ncbi:MAG: condensation domain-containing protein, partial [Gammaproteobacteria bacterium]
MTDLNQHIAHLSAEQRALLATRIQDKKAAANSKQTIARLPRVGRTYSFPMSFAQQRLWFLDQLEPGSTSYNTPRAIRLDGCLQIKPLQRAIMDIVARHETLRTRFITQDGEPLQLIIPDISVAMPIVDLGHLSGIIQQQEVERLAAADVNQPFDLTTGPLLRTTLLHLGEQRHILLLTIHHVVSDAWSMSVFFKELATLYEAFSTDRPSPLPDLPIQYADFSQWQRAYLQGETLNVQLGYWKRQLQDLPSRLELPTDRAHSTPPEVSGASQSLTLPQVMSDSLNVLNRRASVTVYMSLLAVFALLLSRYTGQRDIVLGSPSAGRTRIETEGLIGFFINNLVLRIDISGNPTFISLLTLVRTVTLDAYTHQDIPFEKLVEELQPEREINRNPLFDVM